MTDPPSDSNWAECVMDVVADALDFAPTERAAFLLEVCGGDESLRT